MIAIREKTPGVAGPGEGGSDIRLEACWRIIDGTVHFRGGFNA